MYCHVDNGSQQHLDSNRPALKKVDSHFLTNRTFFVLIDFCTPFLAANVPYALIVKGLDLAVKEEEFHKDCACWISFVSPNILRKEHKM